VEEIANARTKVKLTKQNIELAEAQLAREQLLREQKPAGSVERQMADLQVRAIKTRRRRYSTGCG
jgi:hypothetical protein